MQALEEITHQATSYLNTQKLVGEDCENAWKSKNSTHAIR
jgi:hypothetical protein